MTQLNSAGCRNSELVQTHATDKKTERSQLSCDHITRCDGDVITLYRTQLNSTVSTQLPVTEPAKGHAFMQEKKVVGP